MQASPALSSSVLVSGEAAVDAAAVVVDPSRTRLEQRGEHQRGRQRIPCCPARQRDQREGVAVEDGQLRVETRSQEVVQTLGEPLAQNLAAPVVQRQLRQAAAVAAGTPLPQVRTTGLEVEVVGP